LNILWVVVEESCEQPSRRFRGERQESKREIDQLCDPRTRIIST
jgi:hypothetical protein